MLRRLTRAWRRDIRVRLFAGMLISAIVSAGLLTTVDYATHRRDADLHLREQLEQTAAAVSKSLARPLFDYNSVAVTSAVSALGANQNVTHLRVLDPAGMVLAASKASQSAPQNVLSMHRDIAYLDGERSVPVGHLEIAVSADSLDEELRRDLVEAGVENLLVTMVVMAVLYLFVRQIGRPFADIQQSLEKLARGDTAIQLSGLGREDQFGSLSQAVQRFRQTITQLRDAQGQREILLREKGAMLDNALVGINRVRNRVLVSCNRRMEEMFGYGPGEMVGLQSRELYADEATFNKVGRLYREQPDNGMASAEALLRRRNGECFWCMLAGQPHDRDNLDNGDSTWICIDINERKVAELELAHYREQLEHTVKDRTRELAKARDLADQANQAKSVFLANMSHEIRTPMNGILGMAHLMRRGGVTPKQAYQLDKIDASGKHLLGVINDILDLSKIEAGKLVLEEKDFSLTELLHATLAVVGNSAAEKQLQLLSNLGHMPEALRGDATRLSQALVNYLANAIKFTERGSITLSARVLEETAAGYLIRFEVSDTGIGMTPEQQVRAFVAFEQADSSTTRKYGGSGLGLAITKRIAEQMGGEVGVDSALAVGSSFWLTTRLGRGLAARAGNRSEVADTEMLLRQHRGKRVLLAEDEPVNQEVMLLLLQDVGLVADLAVDGTQALRMAELTSYDLILMDMQMPLLDGVGATHAIRRLPGRATVPIVAITANAFADDRQKCLDSGMNDFMTKPVDSSDLFARLLKWLAPPQSSGQPSRHLR